MLKRAHMGTFHKLSPKHLHQYVNEFSGRHNIREADTEDQIGLDLKGGTLSRLTSLCREQVPDCQEMRDEIFACRFSRDHVNTKQTCPPQEGSNSVHTGSQVRLQKSFPMKRQQR